jgi:hypothetical protein
MTLNASILLLYSSRCKLLDSQYVILQSTVKHSELSLVYNKQREGVVSQLIVCWNSRVSS